MNKLFSLVLIFGLSVGLNAQANLDSLYNVWLNKKMSDSLRTIAYEKFIFYKYSETNIDSLISEAQNLIQFGKAQDYPLAIACGYNLIGEGYDQKGIMSTSLENFQKSYKIITELGLEKQFVPLVNTLGALHSDIGNSTKGLEYFEKGLALSKEVGDKETMEMCVSNIGGIHYDLGNFDKALEYYIRGRNLEKEMGDRIGYASSLNLISRVLIEQGDIDSAISNLKDAIDIFEEEDDDFGIQESNLVLGEVYALKKDYKRALEYLQKCANSDIAKESAILKAFSYNLIGEVYIDLKQFEKAKLNCEIGLKNADASGIITEKIDASKCLYKAYKGLNKNITALKYLEQSIAIEDSLTTQDTNNKIMQMEVEKQALNDSIQAAKERFQLKLTHQQEVQRKNRTRNIILVVALFVLVIAIGLYSRWRSTQKSKAIIEKEKERSENLLLNILPADVAKELKEKGKADARGYDLVSILFTDFKEFTETAEKLTAKALVNEINVCFKAFDNIIEKYNIEKIKTIGDAYMAAGGLPIPDDNAVKNTVLAGLEMQQFIINRKKEADQQNKISFDMRVGIHTGPIVAGIVGVKKFQYDIWGDTVNTASRIESNGKIGSVNISQSTYELIKDISLFEFEYRGKVFAKGKGNINMYFVSLKG